jgi:flavodoxin
MNALVVYDSQYGNTERIARAIADGVGESGQVRAVHVNSAPLADLQSLDMLVVGCPTRGWRPTPAMQSFLEEVSSERSAGPVVACFDTRFRLPRWLTGSAAKVMAKELREKGASLLVQPESFFVKGSEGPLHEEELNRASAWARTLLEKVEAPRPAAQRQP